MKYILERVDTSNAVMIVMIRQGELYRKLSRLGYDSIHIETGIVITGLHLLVIIFKLRKKYQLTVGLNSYPSSHDWDEGHLV